MNPIYFAHLTDTHLTAPENKSFLNLDTAAKFKEIIASLKKLSVQLSFVVISGDLAHEGNILDYEFIRDLMDEQSAELGVPIFVALGNHDHLEPFREGFLKEHPSNQPYYYSKMIGELRLVVLNTQVPGRADGFIDEEQLQWLNSQLATAAPAGTVIVLHHPPHLTPTPLLHHHLLTNPSDLAKAIEGSDVLGILSGHIHFNNFVSFHGVPCAAATGAAFGLDPSTEDKMIFLDNCGYNLITVQQGVMSVHPMVIPGEHRIVFEWTNERNVNHA